VASFRFAATASLKKQSGRELYEHTAWHSGTESHLERLYVMRPAEIAGLFGFAGRLYL